MGNSFVALVWGTFFLVVFVKLVRSVRLVPNQRAFIVERLGRYQTTLKAGFHILIPFLDKVTAKLDLREETIDVPPQDCFTFDEVKVEVDGVMYISVIDPVRAAYGVTDYRFAAVQLAQTTTRAVMGKIELDRTFEERELISSKVVSVLEGAGQAWGIRVHRYEIKNIAPPPTVRDAMEKQVTAERDRKAHVSRAEGEKQSRINRSEGQKMELINRSEGEKQRRINEATGYAEEILAVARANAASIDQVASAVLVDGGRQAVELQLTKDYLKVLAEADPRNPRIVLPLSLDPKETVAQVALPAQK